MRASSKYCLQLVLAALFATLGGLARAILAHHGRLSRQSYPRRFDKQAKMSDSGISAPIGGLAGQLDGDGRERAATGPDRLTRVLQGLVMLCWGGFIVLLSLYHFARPQTAYGFWSMAGSGYARAGIPSSPLAAARAMGLLPADPGGAAGGAPMLPAAGGHGAGAPDHLAADPARQSAVLLPGLALFSSLCRLLLAPSIGAAGRLPS